MDLSKRVSLWFDASLIVLNVSKSSFLVLSRVSQACPQLSEIHLSKGFISRPKDGHIRFLRIILDEFVLFLFICFLLFSSLILFLCFLLSRHKDVYFSFFSQTDFERLQ